MEENRQKIIGEFIEKLAQCEISDFYKFTVVMLSYFAADSDMIDEIRKSQNLPPLDRPFRVSDDLKKMIFEMIKKEKNDRFYKFY